MMLQLAKIERRFLELESLLSLPDVILNNTEFRKLSKERADMEETVRLYNEFKKVEEDTQSIKELIEESIGEMRELAYDEFKSLKNRYDELKKELAIHLLPKDPNDEKNIFLEIRAGAGGDEASLFAGQLFRAYARYVERKKWKMEIMSLNENEAGGTKEVIALIAYMQRMGTDITKQKTN